MIGKLKFSLLFFLFLGIMDNAWSQTEVKKSTASANVKVLDTAFYIPQLQRHRRVWIYLPKNYFQTRHRFPVLYLHDGQNVFDAATSYAGEWGVDEALDSLAPKEAGCIVVAIDNGGDKRLSEYSPYDFSLQNGGNKMDVKGEGDAYADFLVKTLRPYIRKHYRVSRKNKHHFVAGSSMGGLISLYAVLKHPTKWGGAGVFSPAFWVVKDTLNTVLEKEGKKVRRPIYLYAGQQENKDMVPDMLHVAEILSRVSRAKITTVIRADETHSEASWRKEFPIFYKWLQEKF